MTAKTLMIQGTSSSVGKSLLVAGLCRLYARRGIRTAPFKAQNMSNNAGVTPDGGEIGRAQVNQAEACGILPHVDMNPVLLKPEADARSQVVVLGRPWATLGASRYYRHKAELWSEVTGALGRLRAAYDLVIIEGAGSAAELNLRAGDIVNMAVARHAQSPVVLAGDIDRGGIFAQLLGTIWLLEPEERALVCGHDRKQVPRRPGAVRGRRAHPGRAFGHTGARGRALGAPPRYPRGRCRGAGRPRCRPMSTGSMEIAVVALPRIANFDDFDPLATEEGVQVRFVHTVEELGRPQAVILPGTKHTLADLAWLRETGLAAAVQRLAGQGVAVVGICGGYQMLGRTISDPAGVEGGGEASGLGLLPTRVVFDTRKDTWQARAEVCARLPWLGECGELRGYEIHAGKAETAMPLIEISRPNGEKVADGSFAAGRPHLGHASARPVSQRSLQTVLAGRPGLAGATRHASSTPGVGLPPTMPWQTSWRQNSTSRAWMPAIGL